MRVINMTLYERIRQLRINAGMSQDDLAKAMGYSDRSMITKIESGKVDISQKKIIAFARVLNTTTSYLMGLEDDTESGSSAQPKTDKINNLVRILNELPPEESAQAVDMFTSMFKLMFPKKDVFEKGNENDANT